MELSETDIYANGIKLHIYRTNTNKPPLLFAHGRSDNGLCFWPIAQQFADNYEPGAGHNIRREQLDAFVTAVRDFLNTAKIGPI